MLQQLEMLPLWVAFVALVIFPTSLILGGILLTRYLFSIEAIIENNEVAGFKFATLGVVYAVILGLAVISVWEKYAEAEVAATREAAAVVSMFRLTAAFDESIRTPIHIAMTRYGESVITDDWLAMKSGEESTRTLAVLNEVYRIVLATPAPDEKSAELFAAVLAQLGVVTEARRERLTLAQGIVPDILWLVLFFGAFITLGFTLFFGLRNVIVQLLMSGMLSLLIFIALFVAVAIDHPFTGSVSVHPNAMELAVTDFGTKAQN